MANKAESAFCPWNGEKTSAGPLHGRRRILDPHRSRIWCRIDSEEIQPRSPNNWSLPIGINSINRTCHCLLIVSAARSKISRHLLLEWSLRSYLSGFEADAIGRLYPRQTSSQRDLPRWPTHLVKRIGIEGVKTDINPAHPDRYKSAAIPARRNALVVRERSWVSGQDAICSTISNNPGRNRGSPPVSLNLVKPTGINNFSN